MAISPIYIALAALVFLGLSARVIRYRMLNQISVGDHGDKAMIKLMRAHANCVETLAIGLPLLIGVEMQGAPVWLIHLLGIALVSGRVLHAAGFLRSPQNLLLRQIGMILGFTMMLISVIYIFIAALI